MATGAVALALADRLALVGGASASAPLPRRVITFDGRRVADAGPVCWSASLAVEVRR